jgi:hypothetical protein
MEIIASTRRIPSQPLNLPTGSLAWLQPYIQSLYLTLTLEPNLKTRRKEIGRAGITKIGIITITNTTQKP